MYICICNGITDRQIRQCAQSGMCSLSELECNLGVGAGCGRCREAAGEILDESHSRTKVSHGAEQAA